MVIPSIYGTSTIGEGHHAGIMELTNVSLHYGEVKRVILPTDKGSLSGSRVEYDVLVQDYRNGGAAHVMYYACTLVNQFCSVADSSDFLLRASDNADYKFGNGSQVFLLCINGDSRRAVIIGGVTPFRTMPQDVVKQTIFNGVNESIKTDGSWSITANGPTDKLGELAPGAEANGASISIEADGSIKAATPSEKCSVAMDHPGGSIEISASDSITTKAPSITLDGDSVEVKASLVDIDSSSVGVGSNAVEPAVLGTKLVAILTEALSVIASGMPTPSQAGAVSAAAAQLITVLSGTVRIAE